MAGLLAWAADVVGGNTASDNEDNRQEPVVFSPDQQRYALELDHKASSLRRSIQDLRLRIPPAHISQRLPHLHAHTVASSAALALQLNAHSTTRQQAQLREVTLQQENAAYEKAISNCEKKIQEKKHEAELLQNKLKEMESTEHDLEAEEKALATADTCLSTSPLNHVEGMEKFHSERDNSKTAKLQELEDKKNELSSLEGMVEKLEKEWSVVEQDSIKQPSPVQREKFLEKQLHSLVEQLTGKQAQAEHLISEIHAKERELEKLNALRKNDGGSTSTMAARSQFGRNTAAAEAASNRRHFHMGGRTEAQQKLMLVRSAFVVYILALHVIVFIKISF